ncbi:hypothetical protein SEA_MACGULLY_41 [Rhodococcus phage MacGully]|nr:hypothetical protein SEA_MACGULLY_41 [Rhodococcus phage MacGully]
MAEDRMRRGYRQNTVEWGKYLRYAKPLDRIMRYNAVQVMWYFRRNARRGPGPGPHQADMVRVEKRLPGGRKKDRMEYLVIAHGPNAAMEEFGGKANDGKKRQGQHTLRKGLIYISDGRTISRGGKVT